MGQLILPSEALVRELTDDPSIDVVAGAADLLMERILIESERILLEQLTKMGVEITEENVKNHCRRIVYPDDPDAICEYRWDDILLVQVRKDVSGMGVRFNIPEVCVDA